MKVLNAAWLGAYRADTGAVNIAVRSMARGNCALPQCILFCSRRSKQAR